MAISDQDLLDCLVDNSEVVLFLEFESRVLLFLLYLFSSVGWPADRRLGGDRAVRCGHSWPLVQCWHTGSLSPQGHCLHHPLLTLAPAIAPLRYKWYIYLTFHTPHLDSDKPLFTSRHVKSQCARKTSTEWQIFSDYVHELLLPLWLIEFTRCKFTFKLRKYGIP